MFPSLFQIAWDAPRCLLRLGSSLLVFLMPILVGLWAMQHTYLGEYRRHAESSTRQAALLMEDILDHAEQASQAVVPLIGKPCEQALFSLREQVALVAFVRTVSLASEGRIYCSSLFGAVDALDDPGIYTGRRLLLMAGNRVRPNHPLLVVRTERAEGVVLSGIDGDYLRLMQTLNDHDGHLLLHIGSGWLDEQGHFSSHPPALPPLASAVANSSRYPFSIHGGMDAHSIWHVIWVEQRPALGMLLLGSLFLAALAWWLLGRPRSPHGELARALRAQEFVPYLQPIVASEGGKVVGAEVLMRWQHPSAGLIPPDQFIPQAEACGLILPMTSLLMDRVGEALSACEMQLPDSFHIGVNISSRHCQDETLLEDCRRFLARFSPGRVSLVLELTERELLMDNPQTMALFKRLNDLGVMLAIDDFGTGHSSLAYLQQFRIDTLKIDQSFICHIGTESLSRHIVDNVIDLASRLDLTLVAEGVETREQVDYLKSKGVAMLQGYYFGRPVPLNHFLADLPEMESKDDECAGWSHA